MFTEAPGRSARNASHNKHRRRKKLLDTTHSADLPSIYGTNAVKIYLLGSISYVQLCACVHDAGRVHQSLTRARGMCVALSASATSRIRLSPLSFRSFFFLLFKEPLCPPKVYPIEDEETGGKTLLTFNWRADSVSELREGVAASLHDLCEPRFKLGDEEIVFSREKKRRFGIISL